MDTVFNIAMVLKAIDNASTVFSRLSNNAVTELGKIQRKMRDLGQSMQEFGTISMLTGGAMVGAVGATVKTFADLEEAQIRLKTLMMDSAGKTGAEYENILKLADRLGTELPGSTKDMIEMFIALREQGAQTKNILGGLGEATAKFAVMMKLSLPEAATYTQKFQEAMGVADNQAIEFMDTLQRLKSASGIETGDLLYSFKYMGASLKSLNIQGIDSAKELSAILGVLAANANEGSTAGTNLAMALSRMAELTHRMDRKQIAKIIDPILEPKGIKLDFFTEAGNFIGLAGMVRELEKLKALNPQDLLVVLTKLFGQEAARPLSLLVQKGSAGMQEMMQRMQQQADMQTKINQIMSGTKMQWDTLTGTFKNVIAHMGGATAGALQLGFAFKALNAIFARLDTWVMNHQRLAGAIGAVVGVTGGALVVIGGLALALGAIFRMSSYAIGGLQGFIKFLQVGIPWIKMHQAEILRLAGIQKLMNYISYHGGFWQAMQFWLLSIKYKILEAVTALKLWTAEQWAATRASWLSVSGIRSLASGFSVTLLSGLKAAVAGIRTFSLALLATPVGWLGLAVAAAALLVYKYWGPISGFFRGLWAGIREGLKGLEPAWDVFKKVAVIFAPLIWPLKLIYTLIKALIKPVEDTGHAAENMGVRVGRAIGNVIKWVALLPFKMVTALADAAKSLFNAGANLINQLWNGIKSVASKPIAAVKEVAQKIRNLLPFSPAKEGPLATLNKVRLMETITENIKAAPLVSAMKNALAAPFKGGGLSPAAAGGGGGTLGKGFGGGINLTFHFTLPKGTEAETAQRIVKTSGLEVEKVMRRKYSI